MPFAKTRIWRGQKPDAPTIRASKHSSSEVVVQRSVHVAGAASANPGTTNPEEPSKVAPAQALPETGFFPIEELLEEIAQHEAQVANPDALRAKSEPADRGAWLRRLRALVEASAVRVGPLRRSSGGSNIAKIRRAMIVVLSLAVVGMLMARPTTSNETATPETGVRTGPSARNAEPVESAAPGPPSPVLRAKTRKERAAASPALERAAVDALASGDLERARELYGRLAEQSAAEPFRHAERVLSRRLDGR